MSRQTSSNDCSKSKQSKSCNFSQRQKIVARLKAKTQTYLLAEAALNKASNHRRALELVLQNAVLTLVTAQEKYPEAKTACRLARQVLAKVRHIYKQAEQAETIAHQKLSLAIGEVVAAKKEQILSCPNIDG